MGIARAIAVGGMLIGLALFGSALAGIGVDRTALVLLQTAAMAVVAVTACVFRGRATSVLCLATVAATVVFARHLLLDLNGGVAEWLGRVQEPLAVATMVLGLALAALVGMQVLPTKLVPGPTRVPAVIVVLAGSIALWGQLSESVLTLNGITLDGIALDGTVTIVVRTLHVTALILWVGAAIWMHTRSVVPGNVESLVHAAGIMYVVGDSVWLLGADVMVQGLARSAVLVTFALAVWQPAESEPRPRSANPPRWIRVGAPAIAVVVPLVIWIGAIADVHKSMWIVTSALLVGALLLAMLAQDMSVLKPKVAVPPTEQRLLHFQPFVRLSDGRVVGAEALLRIRNLDGSVRSGGSLIQELEKQGSLEPMSDWILEEAFRQGSQLLAALADWDATVSINLAPDELNSAAIIPRIRRAMQVADVQPDGFGFEITERSIALSDPGRAHVRALQDMGFSMLLDDFGTGFSNLVSIAEIDFDLIKIDHTLVHSAHTPRGRHLLERTVNLLDASGSQVLMEGVETDEHAKIASTPGVDFVQGYHYALPMPMPALLRSLGDGTTAPDSSGSSHDDVAAPLW